MGGLFMEKSKSELYREEFKYIFSNKAFCVRGALVTAAFIEGQVFLLAKSFLEIKSVKFELKGYQGYRQALNILKDNGILTSKELKSLEKFQEERNKSIHGIFKGMTRPQWEQQNTKVVQLGRPIVENLDEKLYSKK
jgi:hypothetical protein